MPSRSSSLPASRVGLATIGLATVTAVFAVSGRASATPRLEVTHVQGRDAPWIVGWNEAVVTLENDGGIAWRGEIAVDASFDRRDRSASVRVPVSLSTGESARVLVPFHLNPGTFPNVTLRTPDDGEVATQGLSLTQRIEGVATIVEIAGREARGAALVDVKAAVAPGAAYDDEDDGEQHPPTPVPRHRAPSGIGAAGGPTVQVTTVQFARESGDPILPDIASGWSGAVVVVASSEVLSRLSGRPLDALEHWVASGGSLAIAVNREEDLRSPALVSLVGVEARRTSASDAPLATFAGEGLARGDVTKEGDDGEVARHGLGAVWLLRRDPWTRRPDPRSQKTIAAIWSQSVGRRAQLMSLPAGTGLRWYEDDRLRHYLDPNHGFRPSLGIAAIFVVIYALLVGPVAFARARRLGKPLSVLRATPILAFGLLVALVGLGKIGKGFRGKARRLAVVDVEGGGTRGTATTFHAFYVADPSTIEVSASRPVDSVHVVEPAIDGSAIEIDRGTIAIRGVRAHPWQTIVVAEEGRKEIPGGIVLEGTGDRLRLINKTPWTLEQVVLHPEGTATVPARSRYFESVAPGASVRADEGIAVDRRIRPLVVEPGNGLGRIRQSTEALEALDALVAEWSKTSYAPSDPLPPDLPIATAIVRGDGGSISGLSVEKEATLLRVVGLGGGKGAGSKPASPSKGEETEL